MDATATQVTEFGNLILSRKKNESIKIGDGVTVSIVEIRGDKVRLGVTAPKTIVVHRSEVAEAIRRETQTLDEGVKRG